MKSAERISQDEYSVHVISDKEPNSSAVTHSNETTVRQEAARIFKDIARIDEIASYLGFRLQTLRDLSSRAEDTSVSTPGCLWDKQASGTRFQWLPGQQKALKLSQCQALSHELADTCLAEWGSSFIAERDHFSIQEPSKISVILKFSWGVPERE